MAIPNPPDQRQDDEWQSDDPVSGEDESELEDSSGRETTGSGLSVALSLAFYVIVLAVGISYDHAHRLRSPLSGTADLYGPGLEMIDAHASLGLPPPAEAEGTAKVLLARAYVCAMSGQWDCVDKTTHAAVALRGDTPDTQSVFEQASVTPRSMPVKPEYGSRGGYMKVVAPMRATHERWHERHYSGMPRRGRYAATRHGSPEYLADLYRH